ncbi:MAG: hypothetical protein LCH43_14005 [Actinobacteria bacterium]|nr:hypothetical protein [Actinomycetota bacterium]
MSPQHDPSDLMSAEAELHRIDHTATIWFAAALIAVALPLTGLLISGWRPADLTPVAAAFWWAGAIVGIIGLSAIGYAGCPIYWGSVLTAHLQKSIAIRAGLAMLLIGSFVAISAVLGG